MRFWKNNRVEGGFDLPVEQIAAMFAESGWADMPWRVDRLLRVFLTDPAGPTGGCRWDDPGGYQRVIDLILERRWQRRHPPTPHHQSTCSCSPFQDRP